MLNKYFWNRMLTSPMYVSIPVNFILEKWGLTLWQSGLTDHLRWEEKKGRGDCLMTTFVLKSILTLYSTLCVTVKFRDFCNVQLLWSTEQYPDSGIKPCASFHHLLLAYPVVSSGSKGSMYFLIYLITFYPLICLVNS